MKFLKLIPLLLLPAVVLPSCSDDDNERDNTATLTLPTTTNFIASYDNTTGTLNSLPGASFNITVNYSASTYQVSVSDLQYAPGQVATFSAPNLTLYFGFCQTQRDFLRFIHSFFNFAILTAQDSEKIS